MSEFPRRSKRRFEQRYGCQLLVLSATWLLAGCHDWTVPAEQAKTPGDWREGSSYRHLLTAAQVSESLSEFPLYVQIVDSPELAQASKDGSDLVFTDDGGEQALSFELCAFENDGSRASLRAFVRMPQLSSAAPTSLYLYYGGAAGSSLADPAATWNGFDVVLHLDDSSLKNSAGALAGSATAANVDGGQLGSGHRYDGSNYAILNDDPVYDRAAGDFTLSAWLNLDAVTGGPAHLIDRYTFATESGWLLKGDKDNSKVEFVYAPVVTLSAEATAGTFHHVMAVKSGDQYVFFVDGEEKARRSAPGARDTTGFVTLGAGSTTPSNTARGILDEVHIARRTRTVGWAKAEYDNQRDPAAFVTVGTQESL